jgi:hypothetical protein
MSPADQSSAFLARIQGFPLYSGDEQAIEEIAAKIRCGRWRFDAEKSILTADRSWRTRIYPDRRWDPLELLGRKSDEKER